MHKSRYIVKGVFKMLKNLESALFKKGISKKAFAEFLGVSEKTIQNKISGASDFSYPEARKILKGLFPEYVADWLFLDESEGQDAS